MCPYTSMITLFVTYVMMCNHGVDSLRLTGVNRAEEGDDVTLVWAEYSAHRSRLTFISCRFGTTAIIHYNVTPYVLGDFQDKIEILTDYLENKGFAFVIKNIQYSDVVHNYSCDMRFGNIIQIEHRAVALDYINDIEIEQYKNDSYNTLRCETNTTTEPATYETDVEYTWYSGDNDTIGGGNTLNVAMTTYPGPYRCDVKNGAASQSRMFHRLPSPVITTSTYDVGTFTVTTFKCLALDVRPLEYHWTVGHMRVDSELLLLPKYDVNGEPGNELSIVDMTSQDNPITCAITVSNDGDFKVQNESTAITLDILRNETRTEPHFNDQSPNNVLIFTLVAVIVVFLVAGSISLFIFLRNRKRERNSLQAAQDMYINSDYLTTSATVNHKYDNLQSGIYQEITESAIYSIGSGEQGRPRELTEFSKKNRIKPNDSSEHLRTLANETNILAPPALCREGSENGDIEERLYISLRDDTLESIELSPEEKQTGEKENDNKEVIDDEYLHTHQDAMNQ